MKLLYVPNFIWTTIKDLFMKNDILYVKHNHTKGYITFKSIQSLDQRLAFILIGATHEFSS